MQNRETKTAKTSVTSEVWHYTQVRESDPVLRSHFFKLLGVRGGKPTKKKSPLQDYFKLLYLDCKYNAYVYKSKDTKKILGF